MPYQLLLGQLVYTSFPGMGFKTLKSADVPTEIQQAFIERVVSQYWNSDNQLRSGYQAVYLHQVTPEHNLFGWLYNVEADSDRSHVPYFHCYYLTEPLLFYFQLAKIFTCLHKGPAVLIDRHKEPATLEPIVFRNFWSFQSWREGVAIPSIVRARSHIALKQGELLDLFVSVDEQEMAIEPSEQTFEQQIANFSIYTRHVVEGIEKGAITLNEDAAAIKAKVIKPYREYKKNLQQYEQALVSPRGREHPITLATSNSLKCLQQALKLRDEDIKPIEAGAITGMPINKSLEKSAAHNSVLRYRNSKLVLKAGIAATILALVGGSMYGLVHNSSYAQSKPEFTPSTSSRVFNR